MTELLILKPQPDFPDHDIQDGNVPFLDQYLEADNGVEARAQYLEQYQAGISELATRAFWLVYQTEIDLEPPTRRAFSRGFSALEMVAIALRPAQAYNQQLSVHRMDHLFTQHDTYKNKNTGKEIEINSADVNLAERHKYWSEQLPNTYNLMLADGDRRGETVNEMRFGLIGAQIAAELQQTDRWDIA